MASMIDRFTHEDDAAAADAVVARIREAGGTAAAVGADVAREDEVERLFATAEERLGPIGGLVNNAGVTGRIGRFEAAAPATFRTVMDVNVIGTMLCAQAALRRFAAHGRGGVIVNVSSVAAATGAPEEYVHYAASKAAVDAFTLGLAREVATQGIRVVGVAPGSTLTEIHARAGEPGRPARVQARIPMRRLAEPEEIAAAIVWLLSDEASYVTGTVLRVGGGA